ncbi:tail fiber domain-containing protein [Flavobacteriaceae bacterium]|nr:tail fiber domain-containing protein [Flavobacteriaceae bacterium]
MKNHSFSLYLLFILFTLKSNGLFGQIKMGDNPLVIDPAAIFEIESKEQGVLLPRMSSGEREKISFSNLPNGLLIFNTDLDGFEYYSSFLKKWIPISSNLPQLVLVENKLSISAENAVDLTPFMDNTDKQRLSLEGNILKLEQGGSIDLSPILIQNSAQQLQLNGTHLILENGGSVDLSPIFSINTDAQQLSLISSTLMLERIGSIDLSSININTDNQKIDQFQLVSNTLFLSIENDNQIPLQINLPETNTDNQMISLNSSSTLSLERGGIIDLSSFKDNTDQQKLNLTLVNSQTAIIGITNGNTIQWATNGSLTFSMTSSNVLMIETQKSPFSREAGVISNGESDWMNENFVFGSDRLDNDNSITQDNKRFFFSKKSGAFRAGFAQSDQWDSKNIGTYSVAMGRNTIASGYNSSAFGISTKASAWYSSAFGQGTEANSRTEMVIGSYNSKTTSLGGTRDWNPLDRLFVIGNGTGSTTASRTDALVMLKNGTTLVNGMWTGPGFTILSDRRLKSKSSKLKHGIKELEKINTYKYELKTIQNKKRFGLMADEVEKIFPELVTTHHNEKNYKSIDYIGLIPVLMNALIEQQKEIDHLKKRIKKR